MADGGAGVVPAMLWDGFLTDGRPRFDGLVNIFLIFSENRFIPFLGGCSTVWINGF